MVGVELVTDRKEKTPAKAETAVLFEKLRGIDNPLSLTLFKLESVKERLFKFSFFDNIYSC